MVFKTNDRKPQLDGADVWNLRVYTRPFTAPLTIEAEWAYEDNGLIYFDFSLDQPGSYQGGVASDDLAKEINWYMDWSVNEMFTLSFFLARNNPGPAIEEAFDRTHPFRYAMVFLSFSY